MTSTCGRYQTRLELFAIVSAAETVGKLGIDPFATELIGELNRFVTWVDTDAGVRAAYESIRDDPATAGSQLALLLEKIDAKLADLAARRASRDMDREQREAIEVLRTGYLPMRTS